MQSEQLHGEFYKLKKISVIVIQLKRLFIFKFKSIAYRVSSTLIDYSE